MWISDKSIIRIHRITKSKISLSHPNLNGDVKKIKKHKKNIFLFYFLGSCLNFNIFQTFVNFQKNNLKTKKMVCNSFHKG